MKRIKIGDIVEVETKLGLSYAQFTHKHVQYGDLLRVFSGVYSSRPPSFDFLSGEAIQFDCFLLLGIAVKRRYVSIVDNVAISENLSQFPIFRTGAVDPVSGKVLTWWLWDGENEWRIGELTPDQKLISILGIWNHALLVERIEGHYTPDIDLIN